MSILVGFVLLGAGVLAYNVHRDLRSIALVVALIALFGAVLTLLGLAEALGSI